MTERGFAEMLHDKGFINETNPKLTWEQVESECKLIDDKKSDLSSESRKVFLVLRSMKATKLRLPFYIQPTVESIEEEARLFKKVEEENKEAAKSVTDTLPDLDRTETPDVQE